MPQEWHYSHDGKQYGPIEEDELKQLAAAGTLRPDDLVWRTGMENWVLARSQEELFPKATTPPPLPVATLVRQSLPPQAVPIVAKPEDLNELMPVEERPSPEHSQTTSPSSPWAYLSKLKEAAQKVKDALQKPVLPGSFQGMKDALHEPVTFQSIKDTIQRAKEAVQTATAPTPLQKDQESQLPILEPLGLSRIVAKRWLVCNCKTKLKIPSRDAGRSGICPACKKKISLPLRGKTKDDYVQQLAEMLNLNVRSPTIYQALDHVVEVLHPWVGKGGTLSFLQMKVLADQIRYDSIRRIPIVKEGEVDQIIAGELKANYQDPLVAAAGTPWKLFFWLKESQFCGCHPNSRLEGEVGHPNPEVNAAYFVLQNELAYSDDPCRRFTTPMLENLLKMAKEHRDKLVQQAQLVQQRALLQQQLDTQEAVRGAAYEQQRAALRQQQTNAAPSPVPAQNGPREQTCDCCFGKGWLDIGSQSTNPHSAERRCPMCGGQGVRRF